MKYKKIQKKEEARKLQFKFKQSFLYKKVFPLNYIVEIGRMQKFCYKQK